MSGRKRVAFFFILWFCSLLAFCFSFPSFAAGDSEAGKKIYMKNCAQCHGDAGDGNGPAAQRLLPKPRNFSVGAYKIRTTPNGELPTDNDLYHAIAKGLPGSSMPAWDGALKDKEIWDVVDYIKTFSERFKEEKPSRVFEIKNPKKATPQSIAKGREIYMELGCFQCHGMEGRADGPSAPTLTDDLGNPIRPANFHKGWQFRAGHSREDIFRTFMTGFNGTPMPSFIDALGDTPEGKEKAWDLANYVYSFSPEEPRTNQVIRVKKLEGAIPESPLDSAWDKISSVDFFLIGQIVQEPRQFNPTIDRVAGRGFYNDKEMAFLFEWDDPTEDRGKEKGSLPDAFQAQIPWSLVKQSQEGERPYFLEGDPEHPVSLWRWDAKSDRVSHWRARGLSSVKESIVSDSLFVSSASFANGLWRLLVKRPLNVSKESGFSFEANTFVPIAFSAWDGANGELGPSRSVSVWYYLLLEPAKSKVVYAYPIATFFLVGGLEVWFFRRRKGHKI